MAGITSEDMLPPILFSMAKDWCAAQQEKSCQFWQTAMERAGCKNLAEFRALPAEKLFAVWQETRKDTKGGNCFPVIDGHLVVGNGVTDELKPIPYMAGATSEDMMPPHPAVHGEELVRHAGKTQLHLVLRASAPRR